MATFNMQDFNEILEKCKDQSQQQKQDQVRLRHEESFKFLSVEIFLCMQMMNHIWREIIVISQSIFRHCCNLLCTSNRFLENRCAPNSDSPSTSGLTFRSRSWQRSVRSYKCFTIRHCCKCFVLR